MSTNENPPVRNEPSKGRQDKHSNTLNVNNLHVHGNDLRELTKLAQINPDLANKVVDQRDRQSAREEGSFRIGLAATLTLLVVLIIGVVYVVVNAGTIALALTIGVIVATALLLRVVLTGEWSETSWIGHLLKVSLNAFGGKSATDADPRSTSEPKDSIP